MDHKYICPTITGENLNLINEQLAKTLIYADRIHLDLMDGVLAPSKSPLTSEIRINKPVTLDIHLMYQNLDSKTLDDLILLKPNILIYHYESNIDYDIVYQKLTENNIKIGLAFLPKSQINEEMLNLIHKFDQILIFGGHLGYQGGQADLANLDKVRFLRDSGYNQEIAWDGGINEQNIELLDKSGINVFDVGGYIQNDPNSKEKYYNLLRKI